MNDWRLISSAPHMPDAIGSGGQVGSVDVDGCDGAAEVAEVDTEADEVEVLSPGAVVWLWREAIAVAMPALAPATTTTLAAASTGAQPRPRPRLPRPGPRRRRGPGCPPRACPASLASRNATSSTVTRRGGSGVTRCSISASCRSSVFTTPHLRS